MRRSAVIKGAIGVTLAAALFASPLGRILGSSLDPKELQRLLEGAGMAAPLLFILGMATTVVVSPLPSLPLDVAAGAFFGPLLGTLYSVVGALIGAVLSFSIARFLGRDLLEPLLGGHINFCGRCSDRLLTRIVFLSRLIPVVSFDIVSYGAGLTKMSVGKFALATGIGMIPLTFVYNYFGANLDFGARSAVFFGGALVLLFFLIPRWIERYDPFSLSRYFEHDET
jgi:uncharacterized membrane protein YdjX (TVP38/TMEM64 family)